MRSATVLVSIFLVFGSVCGAVDFLGGEICADHVRASIVLPEGSPLSIENVEVGEYGALVLLLRGKKGSVLSQVNDLMVLELGVRGTGGEDELLWKTESLTAFANLVKPGVVALAVSSSDTCVEGEPEVGVAASAILLESPEGSQVTEPAPALAAAALSAVEPVTFELVGSLKHRAEDGDWVDVSGVVVNRGDQSYKLAAFDIGLFDAEGNLICVDTISVTQLRAGQERAFRDWMRCADYSESAVARTTLQFAGGY